MMNRNRNMERAIRRRERERLADLNRDDPKILRSFIRITAAALAILACVMVLIWASAVRADQEAFAATLRRTRLIREEISEMGETREYLQVPPLPEFPPVDGEPPEAIEIVSKMEIVKAETIPEERWESLGRWKLTFYCKERCCNGRNAHRTASGAPMVEGRTVAVGGLPFGTELMIDGHRYVVEDRGVRGNHVDILVSDHQTAKDLGVKYAEVFVKK